LAGLALAAVLIIVSLDPELEGLVRATNIYLTLWVICTCSVVATVFALIAAWREKQHISLLIGFELALYALPTAAAVSLFLATFTKWLPIAQLLSYF
jgi:ABC-type tungstate transport system substrate-binding protein